MDETVKPTFYSQHRRTDDGMRLREPIAQTQWALWPSQLIKRPTEIDNDNLTTGGSPI